MDASNSAVSKKKRKCNFTSAEIETVLDSVGENMHIISSSLTNTITNSMKKNIWKDIASKVSAVSSTERSSEEVRKKWKDMKATAKRNHQEKKVAASKTGGGPPPEDISMVDNRILQLMPPCVVDGISGGYESEGVYICMEPLEGSVAPPLSTANDTDIFQLEDSVPETPEAASEEQKTASVSPSIQSTKNWSKKKALKRPKTEQVQNEDHLGTLIGIEKQKAQSLEDILAELRSMRNIQQERLSLEKQKIELLKHQIIGTSLSPVIKFD